MNKGNLNAALRDLASGRVPFVDVSDIGKQRSHRPTRPQAEYADQRMIVRHQTERRLARKAMGRI